MIVLPLTSPPTTVRPTRVALAAVPPQGPATDTLPLALRHTFAAPVAAEQALAAPRPDYRDVIVWLSRHTATLDRVIYPQPQAICPAPQSLYAASRPAAAPSRCCSARCTRNWPAMALSRPRTCRPCAARC